MGEIANAAVYVSMYKVLCGLAGVVVGLAVPMFTAAGSANAEQLYPWCVVYGGGRNGIDATVCGFNTFAQCRETASGMGGFCQPNPAYPAPVKNAVKKSRKRHRQ